MQVDIRHSPAFAVARCVLAPNEQVKVQPGAMMAHSYGVEMAAKMDGGLFAGIGRAIAGESFMTSTFSAPQGGWLDLVSNDIGDLFVIDVSPSTDLMLTRGAWVANDGSVELKPDASFKSFAAGEGGIILRARGQGQLIGSAHGGLDVHTLKPGEGFTIDSGHLVAWESTVQMRTRTAGGFFNALKSGEGLVVDLTGPGDVVTQSLASSRTNPQSPAR